MYLIGSPHIVIGHEVDRQNIIKQVTIKEKKSREARIA